MNNASPSLDERKRERDEMRERERQREGLSTPLPILYRRRSALAEIAAAVEREGRLAAGSLHAVNFLRMVAAHAHHARLRTVNKGNTAFLFIARARARAEEARGKARGSPAVEPGEIDVDFWWNFVQSEARICLFFLFLKNPTCRVDDSRRDASSLSSPYPSLPCFALELLRFQ